MTQALAAFDEHGLVLATDSRATCFSEAGQAEFFAVEKLLPLGRFSAILSGGAGVSVPLTLALRHAIGQRRGLDDLEHMVEFALEFITRAYNRYLHQHGPEPEGFRRLYFVMAGYSPDYPPPDARRTQWPDTASRCSPASASPPSTSSTAPCDASGCSTSSWARTA